MSSGTNRSRADLKTDIRQLARQRTRIGRKGEHDDLIEHEADADRRQQAAQCAPNSATAADRSAR
jgi:hypothetical protein